MTCEDLKQYDIVVDCRTLNEYNQVHIKNSILIPINEFINKYESVLNPTQRIAVYCRTGARASSVVDFLKQNGYTKVDNVGGIIQFLDCTE